MILRSNLPRLRILKVKEESARILQDQFIRFSNGLRYKFDDLPSNVDDS